MAADISESGGHDCKGDSRSNAKLDADYPLRVLYCGGKCAAALFCFVLVVFLAYCVCMLCDHRFTYVFCPPFSMGPRHWVTPSFETGR